ncbi:MAG: MerR family transcriptional regulator [Xanthomonadales bacterium]|nr:MerR family transcriptional regulator [Xanthomonadales bacterium]
MGQLLRIGEFAALNRISIKTLRYYEAEALFRPAFVDPITGYRFYRTDQCANLALVTNLRAAGFSIAQIAALLHSDLDAIGVGRLVEEKRLELANDIQSLERQRAVLETLARSMGSERHDPLSAVKLSELPESRVHSIRKTVPSLGEPVTDLFEAAESDVGAVDARSSESPFLLFHDADAKHGRLDLEVCIPVKDDALERIEWRRLDACPIGCSVVYAGEYAQTDALRSAMLQWVSDSGLEPAGPLREIYHRFGASLDGYQLPAAVLSSRSEDYITELFLPVQ